MADRLKIIFVIFFGGGSVLRLSLPLAPHSPLPVIFFLGGGGERVEAVTHRNIVTFLSLQTMLINTHITCYNLTGIQQPLEIMYWGCNSKWRSPEESSSAYLLC